MAMTMATESGADLRQLLKDHLASRGLKIQDAADMMGVPRSTLSRFINNPDYSSTELVLAVEGWLYRQANPEASQVDVAGDGFVVTGAALDIEAAFLVAQEQRRLSVVVGYPGIGKTFSLERIVSRVPGTVMVRANSNMSCAGLCIRIGQQLGLDLRNGQSLDFMIDSIVAALRKFPPDLRPVIIIDEADYLVTRTSLRKVEILRTIYDEAKVGMLICGMPRLLDSLTAGPNMRDNLSQLYSRVAFLRVLQAATEQEIRAFLRSWDVDSEAFVLLYKAGSQSERGNFRRLDNLVRNAALLADGGTIRATHVRKATAKLELTRQ